MIRFDSQKCINNLKTVLGLALYKAAKLYIEEAKSSMLTSEGRESIQDIDLNDVKIVSNVISVMVTGGAYAAMDHFGTGSLMDRNNPALPDYMASELWNPARNDYYIAGRPKGYYTNIFGKRMYSAGKREGQNIEFMRDVNPMPPSYALETAARWLRINEISKIVKDTISQFDFSLFFIEK